MNQINNIDSYKQRPELRSKECPKHIVRINRFHSYFSVQNCPINNIDDKKYALIEGKSIIVFKETFPIKNYKLKVPRNLES
jgi:hypothetical protein